MSLLEASEHICLGTCVIFPEASEDSADIWEHVCVLRKPLRAFLRLFASILEASTSIAEQVREPFEIF